MEKKLVRAVVTECLPGSLYKISFEGKEFICYVSGKMRLHHIKVLVGDTVDAELDPYKGKTSNRIVARI